MSWLLILVLTLIAGGAVVAMARAGRAGILSVAAVLMLGLAGFALQTRPGLAGAPKAAAQQISGDPAAEVAARLKLSGKPGVGANSWQVIGDALARNGQFADAAGVLLGAVEKQPNNAEAWLAMANALMGHSEGVLTPASLYAYRRAAQAAPDHPGPPFFLGLALAQSGRFSEARAMWQQLLGRAPSDAPWRADLTDRLGQLDRLIAQQNAASAAPR